jgi:uncharacterized protein YkwD
MKISTPSLFLGVLMLASLFGAARPAMAGECFSDPIYDHDWTGTVTTGAFVRDLACMEGSTVMTTLAVGTTLAVTGETDGWWRVQLSDGTTGWVGDWLLSVTEASFTGTSSPVVISAPIQSLSATAAAGIRARTLGYILLQVESHGEAWYVDPVSGNRYYMKDGPTAYEMMRTFGLGMTEADYVQLASGDAALVDRLRGRIVLRVKAHGEAYYIHPDGTVYYLADGPAAYTLMREHSLGITNLDLTALTEAELELIPYDDEALPVVLGARDENLSVSAYQAGAMPPEFNPVALNQALLDIANTERAWRGLPSLTLDQTLLDTSAAWAAYMGTTGDFTHTRPYGESLLSWFKGFNYPSQDVGENLAVVYIADSTAGMESILSQAMSLFMAEEAYNGLHYQNVVDPDWDKAGAGFYLHPTGDDSYQVYAVFHFADID